MSLSISECEKSKWRLIESTLEDAISFRSTIVLGALLSDVSGGAGDIPVGGSGDDMIFRLLVFFIGDEYDVETLLKQLKLNLNFGGDSLGDRFEVAADDFLVDLFFISQVSTKSSAMVEPPFPNFNRYLKIKAYSEF